MKTSIIQIGNSKGVRIPKALLEESGLPEHVEIKATRGKITISAAPKQLYYNPEYLLSLASFAEGWDSPEEDDAWAYLKSAKS